MASAPGKHARLFAQLAHGGGHRFGIESLLVGQLPGAMHAAEQHFVPQRKRHR